MMTEFADTKPAARDAILAIENLVKQFPTAEGMVAAVDSISFTVRPGEFMSVIGPSGCGKSTLFNIIGGLIEGHDGRVSVAGETVRGPHPAIGMVFQEELTFPWRTVIENVAFPPRDRGHGEGGAARSGATFRPSGRAGRF